MAGTGGVDLTDKVMLQYYKLAKQPLVDIYLEQGARKDIDEYIQVIGIDCGI
jgi:hypothetical protein